MATRPEADETIPVWMLFKLPARMTIMEFLKAVATPRATICKYWGDDASVLGSRATILFLAGEG